MKVKIEVKSWNNYYHPPPPPPHTHTHSHTAGGGLFDLPCTQGQLFMDAKLFIGTTYYKIPKIVFVFENKPIWITYNCMVSMATHRAL